MKAPKQRIEVAASKEGSRFMPQGVYLDVDKRVLVATSGILVAVGDELKGVGVLMPILDGGGTAEQAMAFLQPKKEAPAPVPATEGGK